DGNLLLWSTFVGGSEADHAAALLLEAGGNMVVAGTTRSADFPTTAGAYDREQGGGGCSFGTLQVCEDVFIARLTDGAASLAASTLLGGGGGDYLHSLTADADGSLLLAGGTQSTDFPVSVGAFDVSHSEDKCNVGPGGEVVTCEDAYVARLAQNLGSLSYGTFLGGAGVDAASGLVLDATGAAFVAGAAGSAEFPTTPGAFNRTYSDGAGFLARLNDDWSGLEFSTFVASGSGAGFAVDPLVGPVLVGPGLTVTRWSGDGALLGMFSVSGAGVTTGRTLVLGPGGAAYIAGVTDSAALGATPGTYDPSYNGGGDAFVAKLTMDAPPLAVDDDFALVAGEAATLAVLANDADPDGDPLTVVAVTQGTGGTVAIAPGGGAVIYTAAAGFSGSDSFSYTVGDGYGGTDVATVAVTVAAPAPTPLPTDEPTPLPTEEPTPLPAPMQSQYLPFVR
ncbi:MAG: Ig-like domain-containing protein, partial [Anaerolineae bacterium]